MGGVMKERERERERETGLLGSSSSGHINTPSLAHSARHTGRVSVCFLCAVALGSQSAV